MHRSKALPGKIMSTWQQALETRPCLAQRRLGLLLLDLQPHAPLARTRLALSNHLRCARMDRMATAQNDGYSIPRRMAHLGLELSKVDDVEVVRDLTTNAA